MNKLVLSLLFLAVCTSAFAEKKKQTKPSAKVNQKVPGAPVLKSLALGSMMPMEGHPLQTADRMVTSLNQEKKEKGLVVMFSANTCPYVIKAQGKTLEAMNVAKELRIGMVVVNSNEAQRREEDSHLRMADYAREQRYTAPYVVDEMSILADAFGATRTPEVFLFDAEGKLVYKGALEDNPADPGHSTHRYLVEAMNALYEGKPIETKETKSIGCSIKRMERP